MRERERERECVGVGVGVGVGGCVTLTILERILIPFE